MKAEKPELYQMECTQNGEVLCSVISESFNEVLDDIHTYMDKNLPKYCRKKSLFADWIKEINKGSLTFTLTLPNGKELK